MKTRVLFSMATILLAVSFAQAAHLTAWDGGLWGQVDRYIDDTEILVESSPLSNAGPVSAYASISDGSSYSSAQGVMSGQVTSASYWGDELGTAVIMSAYANCSSSDYMSDLWAYGNVSALVPAYTGGIFFIVEGDAGEPVGTRVWIQWRWSAQANSISGNAQGAVGGEHMCLTRNVFPPIDNPGSVIWSHSSVPFTEPGYLEETGEFVAQVGDVIGVFLSASATTSLTGVGTSMADVSASMELLAGGALPVLWEYPYAPGLVYDPVQNITFLKDWSAAATSTAWYDANDWAQTFTYTSNGITYSDWRLPTTVDEQGACVGEFGFLSAHYGISMDYWGPFTNLLDGDYWTAPPFSRDPDPALAYAFTFSTVYGPAQWYSPLTYECYVIPVFDGPPMERWCPADFNNDGIVNFVDFAVFSSYWLHQREESLPM
jgi:hypothetical protein